MKSEPFTAVVTADQVASRRDRDRVPAALAALGPLTGSLVLPFERTVGDEVQALSADADAVVAAVEALTRLGGWRIGIGIGGVESPLPDSTREARGTAYVAAREAVTVARRAPTQLAVALAPEIVGADPYRGPVGRRAESALVLWRWLLQHRSTEGWGVIELVDAGVSGKDAAARLGISPSAVSQRLARAGWAEGVRGAELASELLGQAMGARP